MMLIEAKHDPYIKNEELIMRAKAGDEVSKEKLFMNNISVVRKLVNKRINIGTKIDPDDLFSIGLVGLTKAYNTYDINAGFKFITYLWKCVSQELSAAVKYQSAKQRSKFDSFSIDDYIKESDSSDDKTWHSIIGIDKNDFNDCEDEVYFQDVIGSRFNKKQTEILKYKMFSDMSFDEIGEIYGCSRQAVQQLFKRCTDILLDEKVLVG